MLVVGFFSLPQLVRRGRQTSCWLMRLPQYYFKMANCSPSNTSLMPSSDWYLKGGCSLMDFYYIFRYLNAKSFSVVGFFFLPQLVRRGRQTSCWLIRLPQYYFKMANCSPSNTSLTPSSDWYLKDGCCLMDFYYIFRYLNAKCFLVVGFFSLPQLVRRGRQTSCWLKRFTAILF